MRITFQATYTHHTITAGNRRHVHKERRLGNEHTCYWHSIGHFTFTSILFHSILFYSIAFYSILFHTLSVRKCDRNKQCQQKVKFQPTTCHEGIEGVWRYSSTLSLTWALYGGGWLKSRSAGFTPGNDPLTIVIEVRLGPRAGLDGCGKSRPTGIRFPESSSP